MSVTYDNLRFPLGFCQCGCGERTAIATSNDKRFGVVVGKPRLYLRGHQNRRGPTYAIDPDTGCWIWTGGLDTRGYGHFKINGRMVLAHRWTYEQFHGTIPPGMDLHHTCENRRCVNPNHLVPLTRKAHRRLCYTVKLSLEDVAEIRKLRGSVSQAQLAKRFGVDQTHISRIQLGKAWTG